MDDTQMPEPLRQAIHQLVLGEQAHMAGMPGEDAPVSASEPGPCPSARFRPEQRHAKSAEQPKDAPRKLFTEARLHGLRARLCEDVATLDSYLRPHVAELAREVARVSEEPQSAPA
jgi:hypothetical protein